MFFPRKLKKIFGIGITMLCISSICFLPYSLAKPLHSSGTIIYIPIDNRPISDAYTVQSLKNAGYDVLVPPDELLGGAENNGDPDKLWQWLERTLKKHWNTKAAVLSGDSLIYGSLVNSRKHENSEAVLSERVARFKKLQQDHPKLQTYVFSSIMRTPSVSSNSGGKEPDYYQQYGTEIFQYTALLDQQETAGRLSKKAETTLNELKNTIPAEYLTDWLNRRQKNFIINEQLIALTRDNTFRYFVLGRDDNAKFSQTHRESRKLKAYAADLDYTKMSNTSGIDEIGMLLLTRAVNDLNLSVPFIYTDYQTGTGKNTLPAFSDEPIYQTVTDYIHLLGAMPVKKADKADLTLLINTPVNGIMPFAGDKKNTGTPIKPFTNDFTLKTQNLINKHIPVSVADIAYYNGADRSLLNAFKNAGILFKLASYSGWNTATNSTGYALGQGILSSYMSEKAKNELLMVRYLDDWAYEADIRQILSEKNIQAGGDIQKNKSMLEQTGTSLLNEFAQNNFTTQKTGRIIKMTLPWNRLFENYITVY